MCMKILWLTYTCKTPSWLSAASVILMTACKISRAAAVETIKSAGRSVPVALVMLKAKVEKPEAVRRLARSDGNVRRAIEDNMLDIM